MSNWREQPVFLSGATGFVGRHLYPRLVDEGLQVRCGSHSVDSARVRFPNREWVYFDIERPATLQAALEGCGSAYFLIHQMAAGEGFEDKEKSAALAFRRAARAAGVERIVYLGGIAPSGEPSRHLASRLLTGRILREGEVSTIELRASMLIGAGSASWQIVRDLAARLPVMVLPAWTKSRTQPLFVDDAVEALSAARRLDESGSCCFDIPGPETLTVEQILCRTARLMGHAPRGWHVPLLTPRLSSYWLRLVTRADWNIARRLVEGLEHDVVARNELFWARIGHRRRVGFDEAARRAIAQTPPESLMAGWYERLWETSQA